MRSDRANAMAEKSDRPRVVYVLTSSLSVRFLHGQLTSVCMAGYDVTVISSPGEELTRASELEGVRIIPLPMNREVSPVRDLISLWQLWSVLRRLRPSITNVATPKAGLLGGLASFFAGVPCRFYTLRGLRLESATGMQRWLLLFTEKLACICAHRVICVSHSLRQRAINLGLVDAKQATVFGSGSSNGVDTSRFGRDRAGQVSELRRELGIPPFTPVIGFVGRFTRDKGFVELLEAFSLVRTAFPELKLLLVGDIEEGDAPSAHICDEIRDNPNIVCTGFVADPSRYYHVMDVLALPTHREGFPNVVLEANAAKKPAVVSDATGAIDSVVDGITGLIVPVGDSRALAGAIGRLLSNPSLAATMGRNAQKRAISDFQPQRIWADVTAEYRHLLEARNLPLPEVSPAGHLGQRVRSVHHA